MGTHGAQTENRGAKTPASAEPQAKKKGKWLIVLGVALVLLLVIVAIIAANREPKPTSSNPIVANYQKQLPALAEQAKQKPKDPAAQTNYAVALYATGDTAKAKDQYEKAVQLDPNNATLRNNLGNAYRDLGGYEKAVDSYQKALTIDAKLLNAYMNLANLYLYTLDQPDLAIKTYQDALKNLPGNQEVAVLLGIAYEQSGDKAKAKTAYQTVLESNPNNAGAQAGMKRVE
jgi:tetratricopeptide (TPR) repeat protein